MLQNVSSAAVMIGALRVKGLSPLIQLYHCKVEPQLCGKKTQCFYKSKSYLNFLYKYWRSQKAFSSFINRRHQFDPSMVSSDTWSDNSSHVYSTEVRYLTLMSIVNPSHDTLHVFP